VSPEEFTAPAPAAARPVEYASFGRRLGAALLDSLVWVIGLAFFNPFVVTGNSETAAAIAALVVASAWFNYFALCEWRWGQTIGKNATGIRVLPLEGGRLSWQAAALRNLLRLVDLPLAMIGADYLIVRGSQRHQRLGDRAAKTIVVREPPAEAPRPSEALAGSASTSPPEAPYGRTPARTSGELFGEASEVLGGHPGVGSAPRGNPAGAEPAPASASAGERSEWVGPTTASALGWTAPGFPYATWDVRRTVLGVVVGLLAGGLFAPLLVVPFDPHFHSTGAKLVAEALLEVTLICVAIGVASGAGVGATVGGQLSLLGLRRFRPAAFGWTALGLFSYYGVAIAYSTLITKPDQKDIARDLGLNAGLLAAIPVVVLIAVLAPIAEEIFFRGMLFGGLRKRLSTFPAAAISALVFGALHATTGITAVPPLIVFGFVLALLYERTGSLVPGMIAHALNNALALALAS
jgi:membrane protease YdiL (CAAX protease family)/uncharacterized RDD family membrane protein YckC